MSPSFGQTAALGVLQGLTEFLPVSSDGHLALAELLFKITGGGLALNIFLHLGTLLATLVILHKPSLALIRAGFSSLARPSLMLEESGLDLRTVLLASLPTAVIGLALRHRVEAWTEQPLAVGLGFAATSAVLLSTLRAPRGEAAGPTAWGAVLIGVAQGLAVLPGLSRSGCTIALALWLGVRPSRAFELSMLMSLPAVAGALLLEAPKAVNEGGSLGPALVGAGTAFVVGLLALSMLRGLVIRQRFAWFAVWVAPLALATLALARAWPQH